MSVLHIVFLLTCVSTFNAQSIIGDLVDVVDGAVDTVGDLVEDILPTPTKEYISRGYDAYEGQFPYQALIKSNGRLLCGASVIGRRWVLTAGHCFYQMTPINPTVSVGSIDKDGGDIYYVRSYVIHPLYRGVQVTGYQYDAAVVQTTIYMEYHRLVQPIVLGVAAVSNGRECVVSGWGRLGPGDTPGPQYLQYAPQRTIPFNQCQRQWPRAVSESNICTERIGDSGPRSGDSGGPLALTISAGFRQIGIVSGSRPGATSYVYTRVSYVYGWMCNYDTRPQTVCHNTCREPNKVLCSEIHTTIYATEASKVRSFRTQ